jgi:hypothetical protein
VKYIRLLDEHIVSFSWIITRMCMMIDEAVGKIALWSNSIKEYEKYNTL